MKYSFALIFYLFFSNCYITDIHAQYQRIDSMQSILQKTENKKQKLALLNKITLEYLSEVDDCDSGLYYSKLAIRMAEELNEKAALAEAKFYAGVSLRCKANFIESFKLLQESRQLAEESGNDALQAKCLRNIGSVFVNLRNTAEALENFYSAIRLAERTKDSLELMESLRDVSNVLYSEGKYQKALQYALRIDSITKSVNFISKRDQITEHLGYLYRELGNDSLAVVNQLESLHISEERNDTLGIANSYSQLGDYYTSRKQLEQAIIYFSKAEYMYRVVNDTFGIANSYYLRGNVFAAAGKPDSALYAYFESLHIARLYNDNYLIADNYYHIGRVYMNLNNYKKAILFLTDNLALANLLRQSGRLAEAYEILSEANEKTGNHTMAIEYLHMLVKLKDSIAQKNFSDAFTGLETKAGFEKVVEENKVQRAKEQYRSQIKIYSLLAGLIFFLVILVLLYRNNKQKQQSKNQIEKAFNDLKAAQAQIIQSEKMASLGELTAGIAHEIQNPLNFVNNFSEVSNELINEMKEELAKGNEQLANEIADDLKQNLEKINHHGKRAGDIVKGMLQHSRTSTGQKELTDINALCDEYLRLAFHGLRGKDKSFNAQTKTDFDASLPKINVVPQELGRVILNLINNAFYAVHQKKKSGIEDYNPLVLVATKKTGDKIEIMVRDNGNGIPKNIIDKIFQPFFTTKPTGQGTGLGLSLSYDIVKAHGGELKVETKEGEETKFIILLAV